MKTPEPVLRSLTHFRTWNQSDPDVDLYLYATMAVPPDAFVAILDVLEPELVQHRGAYFLARGFTADVFDGWAERHRDLRDIQRVMNHIHVDQFFRERDVLDCVYEFLGERIARHWSLAFRDLGLVAECYGVGSEVEVTLYAADAQGSRGAGTDR